MATKKRKKQHLISDVLLAKLRSGAYQPGQKVPSDRDLAEMTGISYMTVRAGVQQLVDAGLLVRRERVGTFVPDDIHFRLFTPRVNVLCRQTGQPLETLFQESMVKYSRERDFQANIVRYTPSDISLALRVLQKQEPCILLADLDLTTGVGREYIARNSNLVLVGYDLSGIGVHSVLSDDAAAGRMATTVLQRAHHKNIAIFLTDPDEPIQHQMLEGWHSGLMFDHSEEQLRQWRKVIPLNPILPRQEALEAGVLKVMESDTWDCTAAVCIYAETAYAVIDAFRKLGLSVPGDVSVVTIDLAANMRRGDVSLTCIEPQFDKHVIYALDAAEKLLHDENVKFLQRFQPNLLSGKSMRTL
ncbi:MAG: LacI family DNA-binding transcriptional regulator [Phycisphaerae bacterium]|nr:LacI family DNA-binding transcriptional regulator [Phycisphaerae bacterium]